MCRRNSSGFLKMIMGPIVVQVNFYVQTFYVHSGLLILQPSVKPADQCFALLIKIKVYCLQTKGLDLQRALLFIHFVAVWEWESGGVEPQFNLTDTYIFVLTRQDNNGLYRLYPRGLGSPESLISTKFREIRTTDFLSLNSSETAMHQQSFIC